VSQKAENAFIQSVHRHLPPESELHREKMANPYRSGTADVWYSGRRDLWIEYKYIEVPKRASTEVCIALSPLQREWLARRYSEGRSVWVVVGARPGGVIFRDVEWEHPIRADAFVCRMLDRKSIAREIALTLAHP
jgi:hypothetical protein